MEVISRTLTRNVEHNLRKVGFTRMIHQVEGGTEWNSELFQ